jgi:hypothetical protein
MGSAYEFRSGTEWQGSLVHTPSLGSSLLSICSMPDYVGAELYHAARRGVVNTVLSRTDLA